MAVETDGKRPRDGMKASKTKSPKKDASENPKADLSAAAAGRLDERLIEKAVTALLTHHAKATEDSKDLLGNETVIQVLLGLEVAPQRSQVKPIPLNIPHGFLNGASDNGDDPPSVCLIVKQESKTEIKELLEKFPKELGCVKKVLGLQSLRTKYHDFAQRRELLHSYDVFMADDRILPMLTAALGKIFFKAKQQPIPIDVTRKTSLPFNILKALNRTHFSWSRGTCVLVVAGRTSMDPRKLVQNIVALVPQAVDKLPRKWANLRSVSIKTPSSMALPVYNKTPQELMEIARLADVEPTYSDKQGPRAKDDQHQKDDKQVKLKKDAGKEKSPLLQALQKQKQDMSKKTGTAETNSSKDGAPSNVEGKKEKKRKNKEESESSKAVDSQAAPEGGTRADEKEKSRKKSKKDETGAPVSSPKTTSPQVSTPKETKRKEPSERKSGESSSSSFVAAQKYAGSKPGYVFKLGPKGLGYYTDVKPVVDHMALEAIMRMASAKKKSSGGGGGGRGGKSSKHHHSGSNKRHGGGGRR
jgi:ribosome biogenesis protein UTP30